MSALSSMVLPPLSLLYGGIVRARAALYRSGTLKVSKLAAPVISIGNLTTGGTGKTPLVEFLARKLACEGRRVCILTRGYGRDNAQKRVVVSDGQNILASVTDAGDEPQLLAETLQGIAAVISDADRLAAGEWAIKELGSDVFILDDGFQHLGLARDLNIVAIDATNPWGGGHLLPYGRLREPRRELSRAGVIVITRANEAANLDSLTREIETLSRNQPLFTSHTKVRALRRLEDQRSSTDQRSRVSVEKPLATFCAIGNPESFLKQVESQGYRSVYNHVARDHSRYSQEEVNSLLERARRAGAKSLVTTDKDAVKLRGLRFELPCYVLEIEVVIDDEPRFFKLIRSAMAKQL
jgi:tetraacyldisaccharide 4'-kinase